MVNLQCCVSFKCIAKWFRFIYIYIYLAFPGSSDSKESACNVGHSGSISVSRSGISPGEENGNPLQYSCMENSKDREA